MGRAGKARSLAWLARRRVKVPQTFVWTSSDGLPPEADDFAGLDASASWAVRSASVAEDGSTYSYAGQFDTVLSVSGLPNLLAAAERVVASAAKPRALDYDTHAGGRPVRMDVIIQKMVVPRFAGVAFSRNPLTNLDEIVIESVDGLGEALVDAGRTPERWIWRGVDFIEKPDGREDRLDTMSGLARDVRRLARAYGGPADLEWAWDGELWFLQIRPITGLEGVRVYSNRISREVMPGLIKPLVWSINMPVVNAAWIRLIERAVGPSGLEPPDLARQFAFRSYFNMTALGRVFELMGFPHDSLEVMMGLPNTPRPRFTVPGRALALLPRALGFAWSLMQYGKRFPREHERLRDWFDRLARVELVSLSDEDLLRHLDRLVDAVGEAAEVNIVVPVLANIYAALLRRRAAALGVDPALVDSAAEAELLVPYDPAREMERLASIDDQAEFEVQFASFMARFGHFSESGNDISVPAWRETPDRVREMIGLTGDRRDQAPRRIAYAQLRGRTRGIARWLLDVLHRRAGEFRVYREAISFTYTFGYGLLRPVALEIGRRLVAAGVIAEPADVMFLAIEEARRLLRKPADTTAAVEARRADYVAAHDLVMPESIYGDEFTPLPAVAAATRIKGVGSARGQYRGILRIVRTQEEFSRVAQGDIIVIPYSDVGWTPLFSRAGAVVAEGGGMLSHSSIVAREYGIPCVVSASGAMQLPDGAEAIVDGLSGDVVVIGETG